MKKLTFFLAAAIFLSAAGYGVAAQGKGCARKIAVIEKELSQAREHNNKDRADGLETALENVKRWCDDDSLKSKAELKVYDKREKVREREKELEEAKAEGKAKKIARREQKLVEARQELEEAVQERDALQ